MIEELPYLKQVSRVKHTILKNYLPAWAIILGSAHKHLAYVDCFAGGGIYADEKGEPLPGSPLIALRLAKGYTQAHRRRSIGLVFVEEDHNTAEQLRAILSEEGLVNDAVKYHVLEEDAQDFLEGKLIPRVHNIAPTFFFVDPYGHPITLPVIRQLLALGQTEILINLMWYRINMDLNNPKVRDNVDRLFNSIEWRAQEFMRLEGWARERTFVDYFVKQVVATYSLRFPVRFSPEDRRPGGEKLTKFYLLHFSNHPKAALLMKDVMWRASDSVAELQFAGRTGDARQLRLIDVEPDLQGLADTLSQLFRGRSLEFDRIRVETLDLPFVEKHYRAVLKDLEGQNKVEIERVESKRSGLKGRDIVRFP
jgi:three-Cys-motif partner protein